MYAYATEILLSMPGKWKKYAVSQATHQNVLFSAINDSY